MENPFSIAKFATDISALLSHAVPAVWAQAQQLWIALAGINLFLFLVDHLDDTLAGFIPAFAKRLMFLSVASYLFFSYDAFSGDIVELGTSLGDIVGTKTADDFAHTLLSVLKSVGLPNPINLLEVAFFLLVAAAVALAYMQVITQLSVPLVAVAAIRIVGPIFVPWIMADEIGMSFLFWNWLRTFISYAIRFFIAEVFIFIFSNALMDGVAAAMQAIQATVHVWSPSEILRKYWFAYFTIVVVVLACAKALGEIGNLANSLCQGAGTPDTGGVVSRTGGWLSRKMSL